MHLRSSFRSHLLIKAGGLAGLLFLTIVGVLVFSPKPLTKAAAVYEIGPGKPYAQLSQVANLLEPGDTVNVYANGTTPYNGVILRNPGTSAAPITVHGVRDGSGRRPILSGQGLIDGDANIVVVFEAGYYEFDGFEITTTSTDASQGPVVDFNPFLGPENTTRDITVKDVYLHDCPSHGFLSSDDNSGSMYLSHIEIARCGGGLTHHSIYLTTGTDDAGLQNSVVRIEYSYIHDSHGGNDIKLRSRLNEVYYNWLETVPDNDYYDLQVIGPDDGTGGTESNPRNSDIVGNVFIQNDIYAAVTLGGDGTGTSFGQYRLVNNTFVVNGANRPAVSSRFQIRSAEFENNVFANLTSGGIRIFLEQDGPNWLDTPRPLTGKSNWVAASSTVPPEFQSTIVGSGNDPGFTNLAGLNLRPALGSSLINSGTSTPVPPPGYTFPLPFVLPTFEPPVQQAKLTADPRTVSGPIDLGAFEASTPKAPTVSLSFNPTAFYAGATTQLIYTLTNANAVSLSGVAFSQSLPTQLKVATTPNVTNACGSGTVTATAGSSSLSVSNLTLAASQTCTIKLQITSTTFGTYSTATGLISSTESGNGLASNSATVQVKPQMPTGSLSFSPTVVLSGTNTTLTYTFTNTNPAILHSVAFTDTLPTALPVANPAGVTDTCGGNVTAIPGSNLVSLNGGALPANGSCVLSVKLTGITLGSWPDQVEAFTTTETGLVSLNSSALAQVVAPIYNASGVMAGNNFKLGATKVGTAKTANFEIANIGNPATTLTIGLGATPLAGANSSQFTITNQAAFPLSITGGQSQSIALSCTPTANGTITATLNIVTNNLNQPNTAYSYTLTCVGGHVVTKNVDDGSAGTLSDILNNQNLTAGDGIVFELTAGNTITFTAGTSLVVPPGVTIDGGCGQQGPGIILDGSGLGSGSSHSLVLSGQDFLTGLAVKKFSGTQIVNTGTGNQLKCVVASKN